MAFRITPAHDPSKKVDFEVPLEDGTVIEFSVRKLHYFDVEQQKEYRAWFDKQKKAGRTYERDYTLKLLELQAPEHYDALSKLTDGELNEISEHWEKQSRVTMGESEPSQDS